MPRGFREGHKSARSPSERGRFKLSHRSSLDKELNSASVQNALCLAQDASVRTDGQISHQSNVNANLTANSDGHLLLDLKTSEKNNANNSPSDHQSSYKLQNLSGFTAECFTPYGGSLNNPSEANDYGNNKPFLLPAFYGIPSMAGSVTGSVPSLSSVPQWLHLINDQETGLAHQKQGEGLRGRGVGENVQVISIVACFQKKM